MADSSCCICGKYIKADGLTISKNTRDRLRVRDLLQSNSQRAHKSCSNGVARAASRERSELQATTERVTRQQLQAVARQGPPRQRRDALAELQDSAFQFSSGGRQGSAEPMEVDATGE